MNITNVKYTAHYENGFVVAQWVGVEMALDTANGESPLEALDRSQELVQQWYKSKSLPFETNSVPPGPPPVIQVRSEDRRVGILVEDILSCNELSVLDSYRLMVKGNDELSAAYTKRRSELIGAEVDVICKKTEEFSESINEHLKQNPKLAAAYKKRFDKS